MGSINFSGVGSGIDWDLIIQQQIQSRSAQVIEPIQKWKSSWEAKLTAFDGLTAKLQDLQSAAGDMDTPTELRSYTAQSSSESVVEASASGSATPGNYSLEINQLADAEVEIHSGVDHATTVVNNSGASQQFVYTYAGDSVTVQVPTGTTLSDLVDLINSDSGNPGVTASILDDGSGSGTSHHLVLRGNDTGADYTITIDAGGTTLSGEWGTLTADASAGASSVTVDDATSFHQYQAILVDDDDSSAEYHIIDSISTNTLNLRATLADNFTVAQNAYAAARGLGSSIASAASAGASELTVDDASEFYVGASVIVADGASYEELTISEIDTDTNTLTFETNLSNDYAADGYVTQLEGGRRLTFEDTDFTEKQAAQNAQFRVDGYPAGSWLERQTNVVNDVVPGVTLSLKGTTGGTPVTVSINEDHEGVKEKINAFVEAYNAVKSFINQKTDYNADSEEAGVLLGNYAAELIDQKLRSIIINLVPGFQDGTDTYTHLGQVGIETIGRTDDESALGTLAVDQQELDAALAADFDAVIELLSASFQGESSSDYLTFYQAREDTTSPGTYDVEADFDASGNLTGGRIKLASESTFRDATVSDPYLIGADDTPEDDLWIRTSWDGVSGTQTGTVRVKQGIAGQISQLVDDVLDPTEGILHNIDESYESIVAQIDDRIEKEQERLEDLRERLTRKYARLEQLLMELQGQQNWAQSIAGTMGWQKED
ncbi:MAG: flagellar filament capping protein FliD [Planctomycetota bacterium]